MCPRYPYVARRVGRCRTTSATSPHEKGARRNGWGPSLYATATRSPPSAAPADAPHTTTDTGAPPNSLKRYGVAFPTVSAPTTVPITSPRAERNQVAIIFMAGG